MFGLSFLGLFIFVAVFYISFGKSESFKSGETYFGSRENNSSHIIEGTRKNKNSTDRHYLMKYNDYVEVPRFKKHKNNSFDYYYTVTDINIENEANSTVVVNKCCGWDHYFNVENFLCSHLESNQTKSDFLMNRIKKERNDSKYLFLESIPDCGSETVLSIRFTSRVSVGVNGVTIGEEGVFLKYCIDGNPSHPLENVVLICTDPNELCRKQACFRKCCPLGYSYRFNSRQCQKSNDPFKPRFYNLSTMTRMDSVDVFQFGVYMGDACGTKGKYLMERDLGEVSYLSHDGILFTPNFENQTFSEKEFCVEYVRTGNESTVESFLCFSKSGTHFENSQLQFFLLSLGFIISCMFLLLTFLVYLFSPKSQNLYGKTLMCYITCLFAAYLCLAIIELKSTEIDKSVCMKMGYSLLFSFLAAFFWLNVMSFDIWKTFRLDRSMETLKANKENNNKFFWYSLYAWSFPSAITGVCAYVNQFHDFPYEIIKPDIGEENCWFSKKRKGIYVFFIAPISLIIAFNVIFYVQTARKIWRVKSDVNGKKMERQKKKKFSANKDQFMINGKLFIVMGITWSLEIISFFIPHPIWYITDAANALHGVFIFAVFVLKKKVLHQIFQRLRTPLNRMKQATTSDPDNVFIKKNFECFQRKSYAVGTLSISGNESKY